MTDDALLGAIIGGAFTAIAGFASLWLGFKYQVRAQVEAEAISRDYSQLYVPLWGTFLKWKWQELEALRGVRVDWDREGYLKILQSGILNQEKHERLRKDLERFDESTRAFEQRYQAYVDAERDALNRILPEISLPTIGGKIVPFDVFRDIDGYTIRFFRARETGRFEIMTETWLADEGPKRLQGDRPKFPEVRRAIYDLYDQLEKAVKTEWNEFRATVESHYFGVTEILDKLRYVTRFPFKPYGEKTEAKE